MSSGKEGAALHEKFLSADLLIDSKPMEDNSFAPLLHVGYVKTGSTWLQKHLTNNESIGFREAADRRELTYRLIKPYLLWYDAEAFWQHVRPQMEWCQNASLVPVLTHERMAGNPISGGYDSTIIADRLVELFPEGRVLIVIREQRDHIRSIYNEYVSGGGACSFQRFIHPPKGAKIPLFDARFLEFHHLISYYQKLFGPERVLVLPFELFVRDGIAFCNKVIRFAGAQPVSHVDTEVVRSSLGAATIALKRHTNFFLYRDDSNPAAPFHVSTIEKLIRRFDQWIPSPLHGYARERREREIEAAFHECYVASNHQTARLTGLDLAKFGYMV